VEWTHVSSGTGNVNTNSAVVSVSTDDGSTLVYAAASNGHAVLLDNKANVNAARSLDGSTPL